MINETTYLISLMDTHFRIFVCLKVAFFDKLYRFNDIPAWGSYANETPSLYLMEWKEVNKHTVSLSLGSSARLKYKKINQPHPFCCTTFVDHLNQGAFTSGKNETKRRQMKNIKDEINLQFCLMCDLLFFFFLQVLLKLRFLGKKQWKKKTKTKQKQKQWLKLNNNNPIQHIMIKLTSLKQLRRACRKKQTIFRPLKSKI